MTKVFDILLDPYHGPQIRVPNCKSGYKSKIKNIKATFHNSLNVVSISKRVILFTIPMTQITVGNENYKRKGLNANV